MNAKDLTFTISDMELMFAENKRAFEEYQLKVANATEKDLMNTIVVEEFQSLKQFYTAAMKRLATCSHGDIVLMDGDKEIKRVKSNYLTRQ